MRSLSIRVPAKVNLLLHVERPTRPDGYHNVLTILQAVSLWDTVEVCILRRRGLAFACDSPEVPQGKENLVVRAARRFLGQADAGGLGVELRLEKRIPVAAGLGGGSADAAAALFGLRALLAPDMPDGLLESIAADVGSDAPFFLRGGTQVGIGRGELMSPVTPSPCAGMPLVLVKPEGGLSTAEVYARYDRAHEGPRHLLNPAKALEDLGARRYAEALSNDLGPVAASAHDGVARALAALRERGLPALVSGSGSCCFGVAPSREEATRIAAELASEFPFAQAVTGVRGGCEVVHRAN